MRIILGIAFILLVSCKTEKLNKEELIDRYYAVIVNSLLEEKRQACEEIVLEDAQAHIDSLIDTWINAELFDTLRFPSKPIKPIKPEAIIDKFQKFSLDSLDFNSQN